MTSSDANRFLFTPPEGRRHYKDGDKPIVCSSTPISLWEIPSYLLKHPAIPGFHAPWLWCGWYGKDRLFKVVEDHYPNDVAYNPWGAPATVKTALKLAYIINREFDIPERFQKLVQVVDIALPNGKVDLGLAVGNNFRGLLPFKDGECLEQVTQRLFEGMEPEWILDNYQWRWTPQDRENGSDSDSDESEYEPPPPPQNPPSLEFLSR
ncbi:hypothetical protein VKT23_009406 [Stygiomarasmius scandens]|uniref:Uncharacterized protein n=1 Tax=Marasmiellus scandens TaxID=2682957 RepID=A0ABR1JFD2_9AGAR